MIRIYSKRFHQHTFKTLSNRLLLMNNLLTFSSSRIFENYMTTNIQRKSLFILKPHSVYKVATNLIWFPSPPFHFSTWFDQFCLPTFPIPYSFILPLSLHFLFSSLLLPFSNLSSHSLLFPLALLPQLDLSPPPGGMGKGNFILPCFLILCSRRGKPRGKRPG